MDLVDDNGSIHVENVARAIERSSSYDIFLQNWGRFSSILGISNAKILDLRGKINRETLVLDDLPREILGIWRAAKGTDATLEALVEALVHCGINDIAESLVNPDSVRSFRFLLRGKVVTLEELLGTATEAYQKICNELKKHFTSQPLKLIKDELTPPELPSYYIPRTLFCKSTTELDPKIFTSDAARDNVFLFKGMTKLDLTRLTEYKASIETSGNQLHDVTVRFILLETDGDFDKICKNTSLGVHVIERKGGILFWVKSNKNLDVIRPFLKLSKNDNSEQELASKILTMTPPFALSIADSPGMGKTLVLANLAKQVQDNSPSDALHLFIILQEFAQQLGKVDSSSSAVEAIAAYSSYNPVARLVLEERMKSEANQLYLFLDGYDEVINDKLESLDTFLRYVKELKNVCMIVTTRSHLQTRLENIFGKLSYEIFPFNKSNQINFLTNYWIDQYGTMRCYMLEQFARICLETFEKNLDDKEMEIAGIPLQCMMLGEVYAEDAIRVSGLESLPEGYVLPTISLFDMYRKLIELKLKRVQDTSLREKCFNAHVHYAALLLFSDWYLKRNVSLVDKIEFPWLHKTFKRHLIGYTAIDETMLYSVGLLGKGPNSPRFIHRTFAEYILAEFIVANLDKNRVCVNFLFTQILGRDGITIRLSIQVGTLHCYYDPFFPVIVKFIEMHLKRRVQQQSFEELLPSSRRFPFMGSFSDEDVCMAIAACACHNLEYTFEYATYIYKTYFIRIGKKLRDMYFKRLPHVVIWNGYGNVMLLNKVLTFTKEQLKADLSYVDSDLDGYIVPNFTLLHSAVYCGQYNMTMYLVQKYGDQVNHFKYLLHVCVSGSEMFENNRVEDRLLIMDMLIGINRDWLEEKDEEERTPLLQSVSSLSLLKGLVEYGANINAYSSIYGTILHAPQTKSNFSKMVHYAFSNGFLLINTTDEWKRTPLMQAIKCFGSVDNELLQYLHDKGMELGLNAQDENGDSILFLALERIENIKFIKKLLGLGADVYHRNRKNQNVVHKLMQGRGSIKDRLLILDYFVDINRDWIDERDSEDCTPLLQENADLNLLKRLMGYGADINAHSSVHGTVLHMPQAKNNYTELVKWAFSNGFNGINRANKNLVTPLMHGIKICRIVDDEVLKIFIDAEVDLNAEDSFGDSVLFWALRYSSRESFIEKLIKYGACVNHENKLKQNAAHVVMQFGQDSNFMFTLLWLLKTEKLCSGNSCKKDSSGHTPADIGQATRILDGRLRSFFIDERYAYSKFKRFVILWFLLLSFLCVQFAVNVSWMNFAIILSFLCTSLPSILMYHFYYKVKGPIINPFARYR